MALETLEIQNYSLDTSNGNFYITGQIMSTDIIPESALKAYLPKLKGKEVRLEHVVPEEIPNAMVGEVVDVWWDDKINAPFAKAALDGDTATEKRLRQELIEDQKKPMAERKYKGFSVGMIIKRRNKETNKIENFFPRELSITEDPVCKPCTINEVSEYSMSEKKEEMIALKMLQDQLEKQSKEFAEYANHLAT